MGNRDLSTKGKFTLITAAFTVVLLIFVQSLFFMAQRSQAQLISQAISEIFSNEVHFKDFSVSMRTVDALLRTKLIDCVFVEIKKPVDQVMMENFSAGNCKASPILLNGESQFLNFSWENGKLWHFKFRVKNTILFYTSLYLTRFLSVIALIAGAMFYYQSRLAESNRLQWMSKKMNRLESEANQTIHDIASPIGALRIVADHPQIPKEAKSLLLAATDRVFNIVNDLKGHYVEEINVSELLNKLIESKRIELGVKIELDGVTTSKKKVPKSQIERVISNIINNSVEAANDLQQTQISIRTSESPLKITITDNCGGIPEEYLNKVFKKGISSKGSSGLGLYHAKGVMNKLNGDIVINNKPGNGVAISLVFGT